MKMLKLLLMIVIISFSVCSATSEVNKMDNCIIVKQFKYPRGISVPIRFMYANGSETHALYDYGETTIPINPAYGALVSIEIGDQVTLVPLPAYNQDAYINYGSFTAYVVYDITAVGSTGVKITIEDEIIIIDN